MLKLAASLFFGASLIASGATFTVTNTNNSGAGSMRQALLDASANGPFLDTVVFNIPSADPGCDLNGVCTIALTSAFDQVNSTVLIDGYTQPGSVPNSDPAADNAVLKIVVNGSAVPVGNGLQLGTSGSTVRGLVINGFPGSGVALAGADGHVIEGNFIGTDAAGLAAAPNGLSSGGPGVDVLFGNNHTIGGSTPAARNVISGNAFTGVRVNILNGTTIQGNLIGMQADGVGPLGNGANGVGFEFGGGSGSGNVIGGRGPGEGNVIAYNGDDGVFLQPDIHGVAIVGNSIHDNGNLGLDLLCCAPVANDPSDADSGANGLQNFPILQLVEHLGSQGGNSTRLVGKLDSKSSVTYDLDFYGNSVCSNFPREFAEGETWLGTTQVTTDGNGHADFDVTLPVATEVGARITATATDPTGNTSEFSQRIVFSILPASGPASGGISLTIKGTDFAMGTTAMIGGVSAAASFTDGATLTATAPVLPPGTSNDVVVTTPDGTTGTLVKGWVADFLDVPGSHQFYSFVTTLVSSGITAGVGGGLYGVDAPTLRQQMAVFILKAKHGLCYTPPPCAGTFTDVPCSSNFAPWIEAMANEGITGGCGGGNFCPTNPVRRDQMAVFLLKGEHGSSYLPPPCAGIFGDVTCPSTFANWIEQLANESITGGCGGGNYCPANANTRGQMAVFLTKTFGLQ